MVKGIYVLLTMFLLMGCATVMNPYKMDNRMHKIELGMTKQKVISILGKDFESAGARITPDGPIESISYKTVTMTIADYSEGYYILSFKNGILVEWFKEKTPINNNGSPDKPGGLSIQLCKSEKKEFYIRYSS